MYQVDLRTPEQVKRDRNSKIKWGVFGVVCLIGIIVWISVQGEASSKATIAVTTPAPQLSMDQRYVNNVRTYSKGEDAGRTDAELITLGKNVCSALDTGTTIPQLELAISAQGTNLHLGGAVVATAVEAYCPQYKSALK
ncbi:MAG: hypothetical protein QOH55_1805 [Microbacteriaceae bacterium]|jgi:hypothetical protein|nr:hypothetical protein [Microbacteriaceae bacterium]